RLKKIIVLVVSLRYVLWCYFFVFQGRAIDLAINKNALCRQVIYVLVTFSLIKLLVMSCDVFEKFITAQCKNIDLQYQWACHAPREIYRDSQKNKSSLNVLFFDYLPELFDKE